MVGSIVRKQKKNKNGKQNLKLKDLLRLILKFQRNGFYFWYKFISDLHLWSIACAGQSINWMYSIEWKLRNADTQIYWNNCHWNELLEKTRQPTAHKVQNTIWGKHKFEHFNGMLLLPSASFLCDPLNATVQPTIKWKLFCYFPKIYFSTWHLILAKSCQMYSSYACHITSMQLIKIGGSWYGTYLYGLFNLKNKETPKPMLWNQRKMVHLSSVQFNQASGQYFVVYISVFIHLSSLYNHLFIFKFVANSNQSAKRREKIWKEFESVVNWTVLFDWSRQHGFPHSMRNSKGKLGFQFISNSLNLSGWVLVGLQCKKRRSHAHIQICTSTCTQSLVAHSHLFIQSHSVD